MPTAADWMTPNPTTLQASEAMARAAVVLSRHAFRHLPVVDEDGKLVGLLLDYSVFAKGALVWGGRAGHEFWFPFNQEEADETVADVMQVVQGVVKEDAPLENVLRRLSEIGQDMLVVVDDNDHPVGVISEHDPMRFASEVLPATRLATLDGSSPVLTTTENTPALEALKMMLAKGIRHLPVVDVEGQVESVVSYRDLVSACGDGSTSRPVEYAIAHPGARVLMADATTAGAARIMATHRIGCIPIVDSSMRATHVISRTDVIRATADLLEDEALFPRT
ncbi:MAG: CBS domain-containing protein [Proteobacteria bacterium]|nr:CBS domain-containing protein [Pseudomonadota bacterium]